MGTNGEASSTTRPRKGMPSDSNRLATNLVDESLKCNWVNGSMMPSRRVHKARGSEEAVREYRRVRRDAGREPNRLVERYVRWAGGAEGTYPDQMEPPTSGHHRGPLHSNEEYSRLRDKRESLRENGEAVRSAMISARMKHLTDDRRTPAGLPSDKKRRSFWFR